MGGLGPAGRLVRIHPPGWVGILRNSLPETGGQTAEEWRSMAGSHELVAGGTAFGLRALGGQQVTEPGRAADQLTRSGYLEALGNGLFGLLHGVSGPKQTTTGGLASVLSGNFPPRKSRQNRFFPRLITGIIPNFTCRALNTAGRRRPAFFRGKSTLFWKSAPERENGLTSLSQSKRLNLLLAAS